MVQSEKSIGEKWILVDVTPKCSTGDGKREVEKNVSGFVE
jgi:hypothetical protein